jgi:hypothetical protein
MAIADAPCLGPFPFRQKQLIFSLARGKYQGFNDSHLAEKLRAEENLAVRCALPSCLYFNMAPEPGTLGVGQSDTVKLRMRGLSK